MGLSSYIWPAQKGKFHVGSAKHWKKQNIRAFRMELQAYNNILYLDSKIPQLFPSLACFKFQLRKISLSRIKSRIVVVVVPAGGRLSKTKLHFSSPNPSELELP
jgi:hypothetical protein